jgi:hypothetical protein
MKSTKEEIADYLAEAQSIVDDVERDGRKLTRAEKARAEYVLEKVRNLKDAQQLRKAIEDMNGSLNKAAGGGGGDFAQAVVAAGFHPKSNPSVTIPLRTALGKGPTLPGADDWNRADPVVCRWAGMSDS